MGVEAAEQFRFKRFIIPYPLTEYRLISHTLAFSSAYRCKITLAYTLARARTRTRERRFLSSQTRGEDEIIFPTIV